MNKKKIIIGGGNYISPTSMAITFMPEGIVCTSTEGNASNPALAGLSETTINDWADDDE